MIETPRAIVCTLFEGSYGIGLAALVNSLAAAGYKGKIYVGFRGALPYWAKDVQTRGGRVADSVNGLVTRVYIVDNELAAGQL